MANRDMERKHFEEAARHVAELEGKVTDQESMIAKLDLGGHATTEAYRLLKNFRRSLRQARVHERLILERLSGARPTSA